MNFFKGYVNYNCDQCGLWKSMHLQSGTVMNSLGELSSTGMAIHPAGNKGIGRVRQGKWNLGWWVGRFKQSYSPKFPHWGITQL